MTRHNIDSIGRLRRERSFQKVAVWCWERTCSSSSVDIAHFR